MKMSSFHRLAVLLLVCAAFAPRASAQASSPTLQPSEVRFLQNLYQNVIANQRMAEMALNQGRTPSVRQLGTNVNRDLRHSREDISILARKKHVSLSSTLTAQSRRAVTTVSNAHGNAFDRTYVDTLLQQLSRILATAKSMSASTRDADLKAFLHQAIPRLERVNTEATTTRARL
jgi:predicted outer membrane protein